jgi:hypothetical protein
MIAHDRRASSRWLAATLLLYGASVYWLAPAIADGTAAGTTISNTATATYEDPNNPGTPINATSNTVVVTVAEVAGITTTPHAITDVNGGTVLPNDTVNFDFRVTNVGNDPTRFFIPGAATITGSGTQVAPQVIGYIAPNGTLTNFGSAIAVPAGGASTDTLTGVTIPGHPAGSIPPGYSLIVRVPVTVTALASSGSPIVVRLGDTTPNDNSSQTQNQPDASDGAGTTEVRTLDNPNGTGGTPPEAAGTPSNGEREASAMQQVLVGAQPQAFATLLKTRSAYSDNSTPNNLQDDLITYGLSLRVEATAPTGSSSLTPAGLVATPITLDGAANTARILISDAVPADTVITGSLTAPAGWQAVFTTTPTSTPADQAAWQTGATPPANATRVGFVTTTTIAAGTTQSGFAFQVRTSNIPAGVNTRTIANLAQAFGRTQGGGTTLVYDESGDQSPSNFNDNGTPGSNTPTTGVADPATQGVDNNNDNTGSGASGEDNVITLATPGTLLNGPFNQFAAVGPSNNNDDFTNRAAQVLANTAPTAQIDPAVVRFNNTIGNPTSASLTNVLLVPDIYTDAGNVVFKALDATREQLPPSNTTVTLSYGSQTAVYTFNGTNFVFTSGSAIVIPSLPAGGSVNYTVDVDLPLADQSTNTGRGFAIPLYAFVDGPGSTVAGRPDAGDTSLNRTIDRVYTGFLRLVKDARIIESDGTSVIVDYPATPGTTNIPQDQVRPGRFIEYRLTYTNISIAPGGAGNATLNAINVAITEDGTILPNNWARDNDINGAIDTSHVIGSATASLGTITYSPSGDQSGLTAAQDVTRYVVNLTGVSVQPGASGSFTFRRRIN